MRAIIIALFLMGCESDRYVVAMCPKDGNTCSFGSKIFKSKQDCEYFIEVAAKAQPSIVRACVKARSEYQI